MTIAEKLQKIAENEQKVYDAGYEKGKAEGGGSSDTSDATATAEQILEGYTAYGAEGKITGTIPTMGLQMAQPGDTGKMIVPAGTYCSQGIYVMGDGNLVPENIAEGVTIFGVEGTHSGGTGTDTSDATALAGDILEGRTAYTANGKVTGTIPTLAYANITPSTVRQVVVPTGTYCAMGAYVQGDANLISENIAEGVSIFGVTGTYVTDINNKNDEEVYLV